MGQAQLIRLSSLRGEDLGKRICFEAIVCGISQRKGLPVKMEVECKICGLHKEIDIKDDMMLILRDTPQAVMAFIKARGAIYERIASKFIDFLHKANVSSGKSIENAESVYKTLRHRD